jgi:hypothetical protein
VTVLLAAKSEGTIHIHEKLHKITTADWVPLGVRQNKLMKW